MYSWTPQNGCRGMNKLLRKMTKNDLFVTFHIRPEHLCFFVIVQCNFWKQFSYSNNNNLKHSYQWLFFKIISAHLLHQLSIFLRATYLFSVADSQLYKRLCPSVRRSVRPSIGLLVRRSETRILKVAKYDRKWLKMIRNRSRRYEWV